MSSYWEDLIFRDVPQRRTLKSPPPSTAVFLALSEKRALHLTFVLCEQSRVLAELPQPFGTKKLQIRFFFFFFPPFKHSEAVKLLVLIP